MITGNQKRSTLDVQRMQRLQTLCSEVRRECDNIPMGILKLLWMICNELDEIWLTFPDEEE